MSPTKTTEYLRVHLWKLDYVHCFLWSPIVAYLAAWISVVFQQMQLINK